MSETDFLVGGWERVTEGVGDKSPRIDNPPWLQKYTITQQSKYDVFRFLKYG